MEILHTIARLPRAGTELQLVGMLRAAVRRSLWTPHLCVLYPGSALVQEVADAGIDVVELAPGPAWDPRRVGQLRRLIARGGFDVVHSSLWGASAYTRLVARIVRPRPVLVMSERRVEDFRVAPARALDRLLAPATAGYIGNSADVAAFIVRAHGVQPGRVHTIRNGIDGQVFRPGPVPPRAAGEPPQLVAVGRLVPQKAHAVLIRALALVRRQVPAQLTIIGEGELRAQLVAMASGMPVVMPGLIQQPEAIAALHRRSDVFVMPSLFEGLPNALLEAQACGLPVVATDVPGIREAVDDHALLVPPNDPEALAAAILRQLERGRPRTAPRDLRTFDDVAHEHLAAFRAAMAAISVTGHPGLPQRLPAGLAARVTQRVGRPSDGG